MKKKLKIWCNNAFDENHQNELNFLREKLGENELNLFPPTEKGDTGEAAKMLLEADIAFGAPSAEALFNAENIKWIQINSAGHSAYDAPDFRKKLKNRGAILTNSSAVYDEPCAQHVLAMIMSLARFLPAALDDQRNKKSWKGDELRGETYLLNGQTAIIYGFGSIGKRLVELLAPLKMNLIGVKRNAVGDETIRIVTPDEADALLSETDHIINILPANDSTEDFFDAERFSKIKKGAKFYNIGRGTTVNQKSLIANLQSGNIVAAYLDVADPEPLPPENPLWTTENCYITPHIAGGHQTDKIRQVEHFLDNFRRFVKSENLINRVF